MDTAFLEPSEAVPGKARAPDAPVIDLHRIIEALPAAVYATDAQGRVTYFNSAAAALAGRTPTIGQDEWCVSWRLYHPDGAPLPLDQCPMAIALKENRLVRDVEIIAERPDGKRVPVMPLPTPLHNERGELIGALNLLVDISDLKRAEEAVALRATEQSALFEFTDRLYRATSIADVYEAAQDAILRALRCQRASILLMDDGGVMRFVSSRGLSKSYRAAVEGHSPWRRDEREPAPICIPDIAAADIPADLKEVVQREGIHALAFIPLVEKGEIIGKFMAYYDEPHPFSDHEIELALTIARQLGFGVIQSRTEEQRIVLVNELNHRVKNTLATVQSIAVQTLRSSERSLDAKSQIEARLQALARAHDVLTIGHWGAADLRDVIETALKPFATDESRITLSGPHYSLNPKQSLALSMAIHELATNAVKYGSLSNGHGRLDISWAKEAVPGGCQLVLKWSENGGAPVTPPARRGFGSRLIESHLAAELGGQVDLQFKREGLVCTVIVPTAKV